jgi:hypothetical protein
MTSKVALQSRASKYKRRVVIMSNSVGELDAQLKNAIAAISIERERSAAKEGKLNRRIQVLSEDLESAQRSNAALADRIKALREKEREIVALKNQMRDLQHGFYTERHARAQEQAAHAQEKAQLIHEMRLKHEQLRDYQQAEEEKAEA